MNVRDSESPDNSLNNLKSLNVHPKKNVNYWVLTITRSPPFFAPALAWPSSPLRVNRCRAPLHPTVVGLWTLGVDLSTSQKGAAGRIWSCVILKKKSKTNLFTPSLPLAGSVARAAMMVMPRPEQNGGDLKKTEVYLLRDPHIESLPAVFSGFPGHCRAPLWRSLSE